MTVTKDKSTVIRRSRKYSFQKVYGDEKSADGMDGRKEGTVHRKYSDPEQRL
jgi:hypothetical protein